ncbi:DUF4826 family protein [Gallaecimonas kandeliae]|uniref:DUF4826 family protein n=1 Tax=Gallaecimonas kandeliae TaxID=3029055 RepID=UPI002649D1C8|nr:DUF4826 family protein [Gallaecimonas kandeliae]WKE67238.1 DUF4826 family protein [Gallaecimonas kandeliae]
MAEQEQQQAAEPLSEEQRQELEAQWVRQSFQKANAYLASKGILPQGVRQSDSRVLAPLVAVWRIKAKESNKVSDFWVITGNLPADHLPHSTAASAREALRHFALNWQMQAENILRGPGRNDKVQVDFANLLIGRAEGLYKIYDEPGLWQQEA